VHPRSIVITGASSGIGRAIALNYAGPGVMLGLLGRDTARLAIVEQECRARGAQTTVGSVDVRDRPAMKVWLEQYDRHHPVDLLVANAGVLLRTAPGELEPADASHDLIQVNVLGVLNTIQPLVPRMVERRRGQIAIIASIAAFTPLAHSPSYSASKAAILNYGLSLRAALRRFDIRVSVVCSGFVETPMIAGVRDKPFNMPAEKAAMLTRRGLERDRAVVMFPLWFASLSRIDGLLPDGLRRWLAARREAAALRASVDDRHGPGPAG
jgi:short-subunit dehydrogenase